MGKVVNQNHINEIIQTTSEAMNSFGVLIQTIISNIKVNSAINKKTISQANQSISLVMEYITNLYQELAKSPLASGGDFSETQKNVDSFNKITASLSGVFDVLNKIKIGSGIGMRLKFRTIKMVVRGLGSVIRSIANNLGDRDLKKSQKNINALKSIILSLALIMGSLLLLLPIMAAFIIASPVIILCVWVFAKVIRLITRILLKALNAQVVKGILMIALVLGAVLVMAIMLMAIATMATQINNSLPDILMFIGGLVLIVVLIGLVAAGIGALTEVMAFVIAGMAVMTLIITLLLLMAYELSVLQKMKLDKAAIMASVELVLDCAFGIIEAVFNSTVKMGGGSKNEPWYKKVLSFIGGTFVTLISAILSVAVLAATFVAISLILILAAELRVLQEIELDRGKVLGNVNFVIETALTVITSLFGTPVDANKSEGGEDWFKSVLEWAGGACLKLIGAILSVYVLAYTFISITLILLMAGELRLLQEINLDPGKIQTNIGIVMSTANYIIEALFGSFKPEKEDASGKDWFRSVLEWAGGALLKLIGAILSVVIIAFTLVSVTLLLFIAGELRLLQEINLDQGKIQTNIGIITSTADFVINSLFNPNKDADGSGENKSWFRTVLEWAGGALLKLIGAILSVVFLALTLVSTTLILMLAGELRLLQEINLDQNKIQANIDKVISSAFMVIDSLFDPNKNKEDNSSDKSWIVTVFEWVGGTLAKLIGAIMSIAFLALSLVSISLVLLLAGELRGLQEIDLDADIVLANVDTVITAAQMTSNAIFDPEDTKGDKSTNRGFLRSVMELFVPGLGSIIDALMSIGFLALSISSIELVQALARQLKTLQSIKLDTAKITKNITTVINACHTVIDAVMQGSDVREKSAGGWLKKLLRRILPSGWLDIIEALMSMGFLAVSVSSIQMVGQLAEWLSSIAKIPPLDNIQGKTRDIINASKTVINCVYNGGSYKEIDTYETRTKFNERYINSIQNTLIKLSRLVSYMNGFRAVNKSQVEVIKAAVASIVSITDEVQNAKSDIGVVDKRLNQMSFLSRIIMKMAQITDNDITRSKSLINNYTEFIDKIGSVDIENLQTANRIFEQMAKFSASVNGNFDQLADTLNEKIAPLMEELKELLQEIPGKIESSATTLTEATPAGSPSTPGAAGKQKDYSSSLTNISNKIEALTNLLKGTKGQKAKVVLTKE